MEFRRVLFRSEQVAREQAVPRELGDHPDAKPVSRVGAREHIMRVDLVRPGELLHPRQQPVEAGGRDWLVASMPPDGIAARRLLDEKLVFRGAAGVLAGLGRQGAGGNDRSLVPADCVLVQGGRAEVAPLGRTSRSPPEIGAAGGGFHASLCLAGTQSIISIRPALTPALRAWVTATPHPASPAAPPTSPQGGEVNYAMRDRRLPVRRRCLPLT